LTDIELEAIKEKTVEEGEMGDDDVEFANDTSREDAVEEKRWTATMGLKMRQKEMCKALRMMKKNWRRMTISVE